MHLKTGSESEFINFCGGKDIQLNLFVPFCDNKIWIKKL